MPDLKRRYDATSRRQRAASRRAAVLAAAHEMFLFRGYAETRLADVADGGGVSVEWVYKQFGGKAGLLRAIVERALRGSGTVPAESRSDALPAADPASLVEGWGRLAVEVAPRVSPILLLVRSAAAQDSDARALADELDAQRRRRMAANAARLADAGHLPTGTSLDEAVDVLWTLSSPEVYDLLVVRRGWSPEAYGRFVARGIAAHLGLASGT